MSEKLKLSKLYTIKNYLQKKKNILLDELFFFELIILLEKNIKYLAKKNFIKT